jgi:hypothetical protein
MEKLNNFFLKLKDNLANTCLTNIYCFRTFNLIPCVRNEIEMRTNLFSVQKIIFKRQNNFFRSRVIKIV